MPKLSINLFFTSSHTVNVRLKDVVSNNSARLVAALSVCFYSNYRTSLLDHLANNHICILLCSNYITESISSISVQNHYESTKLQRTVFGLMWVLDVTSKRGTDCTHPSQKGQQAAANACHGKPVPAIKGMQLELQIKHSKIFPGVKKKCLGMLFGRPYQRKFYLYSYTLNCSWCNKTLKKRTSEQTFSSVQMVSCHVNVPRSALQE